MVSKILRRTLGSRYAQRHLRVYRKHLDHSAGIPACFTFHQDLSTFSVFHNHHRNQWFCGRSVIHREMVWPSQPRHTHPVVRLAVYHDTAFVHFNLLPSCRVKAFAVSKNRMANLSFSIENGTCFHSGNLTCSSYCRLARKTRQNQVYLSSKYA